MDAFGSTTDRAFVCAPAVRITSGLTTSVQARTHDGRAFRLLTVIDEYTRECLAIQVARQIRSDDVVQLLADLFVLRGPPEHLRSDNGPEFCAQALREWLGESE